MTAALRRTANGRILLKNLDRLAGGHGARQLHFSLA
jgi:hypothetical protein